MHGAQGETKHDMHGGISSVPSPPLSKPTTGVACPETDDDDDDRTQYQMLPPS